MLLNLSCVCCSHFPYECVSNLFSQLFFSFFFFCRWSVWKVPRVGRCRPVYIRYFFLFAATPQNPPTEIGSQRYTLPVCLSVFVRVSFLYQSCSGLTANVCQLPLYEPSQISQAVSLASIAQRHSAQAGHLTHIRPLFCHHCLTPAANLIGLYAFRTLRANFVDE